MRTIILLSLGVLLALAGCSTSETQKLDGRTKLDGRKTLPDAGGGEQIILPDGPTPDVPIKPDWSQQKERGVTPDQKKPGDLPLSPDATCSPPANDTCAGPQTLTWGGTSLTVNGDTSCATNDTELPDYACTGDETWGQDQFYKVQLPAGTYTVRVTPDASWDPALYVITDCTGAVCQGSDEIGDGLAEVVTLTPSTTTIYLIGVDSYDPSVDGSFSLEILSGTPPDAGPPVDGATPVDSGPPGDGGATKLVITEVMADPVVVADGKGEWFEIYNAGSVTVNLHSWVIKDKDTDTHTITAPSGLNIAPGEYLVLGNNSDSGTNGGVNVAYQYTTNGTFFISNADEIFLVSPQGATMDEVSWTGWSMPSGGASIQLKGLALDNNVEANWCVSQNVWVTSGDKGTPKAANDCP